MGLYVAMRSSVGLAPGLALGLAYMLRTWLGGFLIATVIFVFANMADDINLTRRSIKSLSGDR